jgi:hypothetical protein
MRKCIFIIPAIALLFTFNAISVLGQELAPDSIRQAIFPHGKWGLQAQTSVPFSYTSNTRYYFIVKRFTGNKTAWRLGINIGADYDRIDSRLTGYNFPDSLGNEDPWVDRSQRRQNSQQLGIVFLKIRYGAALNKIGFYWGIGPAFDYSRYERKEYPNYSYYQYNRRISSEYAVGPCGVMGVEYYPIKQLGISIEYSLKALYSHTDSKSFNYYSRDILLNKAHEVGDGFDINNSRAECGVTFYF